MEIVDTGQGELIGWHDPDENRAWVRDHKPRGLIDKMARDPWSRRPVVLIPAAHPDVVLLHIPRRDCGRDSGQQRVRDPGAR